MTERCDLHDEHGRITGYVLREAHRRPRLFASAAHAHPPESPAVEAACRIVGLVLLAALGLLVWTLLAAS